MRYRNTPQKGILFKMSEFGNNNLKTPDNAGGEYVYRTVVEEKKKSRAWSVAALVLGIVSILCCCIDWFGLVAGVLAVIFTVISRKNLGYFDGLSIGALITAIFGIIFSGVLVGVGIYLNLHPEILESYLETYYEMLKDAGYNVEDLISLSRGIIGR